MATAAARMPDWPAMMTRQMAADYCTLSVADFEREIIEGRLPKPVTLGGKDHWHRPALDRHLDLIANAANDWRSQSPLFNAQGR